MSNKITNLLLQKIILCDIIKVYIGGNMRRDWDYTNWQDEAEDRAAEIWASANEENKPKTETKEVPAEKPQKAQLYTDEKGQMSLLPPLSKQDKKQPAKNDNENDDYELEIE